MKLKGDAKFKEKLVRGLKNDIRSLVSFHARSRKSENFHFDGFILSRAYKASDEKVQKSYVSWHCRVMQNVKKNWLFVPKFPWWIWWILMRAVASLKTCTLMSSFCPKYIKLYMKKYRRVMFHDTEKWFKQKITLEKYAFSVWCNRLGAVREKYSGSAGNIFDNCLAWSSFYS